jgi:hypothetical protein
MEQRLQTMARATNGDADAFASLLEPLLDPAYRLAAVMLAEAAARRDRLAAAVVPVDRRQRVPHGQANALVGCRATGRHPQPIA